MGDSRQVNAHCTRMWSVQKGDKLVAYCGRGVDINPTVQRRQCAILAGDGLHSRFLDTFAVAQHGISSPPAQCLCLSAVERIAGSILGIAIRVPEVSASKCVKTASL